MKNGYPGVRKDVGEAGSIAKLPEWRRLCAMALYSGSSPATKEEKIAKNRRPQKPTIKITEHQMLSSADLCVVARRGSAGGFIQNYLRVPALALPCFGTSARESVFSEPQMPQT